MSVGCASEVPNELTTWRTDSHPVIAEPQTRTEAGWIGVVLAGAAVDVAPKAQSELIAVHVRAGDPVAAGQILATLDDGDAKAELAMAMAELDSLESACATAELELAAAQKRVAAERRLGATGIASLTEVDDAELAVQRALAQRKSARAARSEQRARIEHRRRQVHATAIVAPFAGSVATIYRDAGATAGPTLPVVRVVATDAPRVRFAVPPTHARELSPGDSLRIEVETVAAPFEGRIRRITAEIDLPSHLVFVEADLVGVTSLGDALRPGLAARVVRIGS
jgi:RND family efflux transporter MFP subunit